MKHAGKHILIIPEGWTEYNYAQSLKITLPRDKQRGIQIEKPTTDTSALQLLKRAETLRLQAKKQKNPYDTVWLFFDYDNRQRFEAFIASWKPNLTQLAYSCIAIEHWFILHLEDNRQPYASANQALDRLNRLWLEHFGHAYRKTASDHFERLQPNLALAIQRNNLIHVQAEADETALHLRNPYFTIPDFISYFQNL